MIIFGHHMNRDLAKENNKRKYEIESFDSNSNNEEQEQE